MSYKLDVNGVEVEITSLESLMALTAAIGGKTVEAKPVEKSRAERRRERKRKEREEAERQKELFEARLPQPGVDYVVRSIKDEPIIALEFLQMIDKAGEAGVSTRDAWRDLRLKNALSMVGVRGWLTHLLVPYGLQFKDILSSKKASSRAPQTYFRGERFDEAVTAVKLIIEDMGIVLNGN